jgi:hypothetical protein
MAKAVFSDIYDASLAMLDELSNLPRAISEASQSAGTVAIEYDIRRLQQFFECLAVFFVVEIEVGCMLS